MPRTPWTPEGKVLPLTWAERTFRHRLAEGIRGDDGKKPRPTERSRGQGAAREGTGGKAQVI